MIRSFKNKDSQRVYEGISVKKWNFFLRQAQRRLTILDAALEDLKNLPSNHFEALRGDRKGQYSIRINNKMRICFKWKNHEAIEVEIIDYDK